MSDENEDPCPERDYDGYCNCKKVEHLRSGTLSAFLNQDAAVRQVAVAGLRTDDSRPRW